MDELKKYLSGIAIGVKYRNNFSIEDHVGSIVDELLYKKSSLFNSINFPYTSGFSFSQKTLHNPQTGDSLTLNKSNIILNINFSEKIPKEKSEELIEEYFKTITERIYKIVDIHDVHLLGIVHKYIITDEDNTSALYKNFKNIAFDEATSIAVSFTKKNILPESKTKKGYDDYENVICIIEMAQERKNDYSFQVDYQHIYSPYLDSIIDIDYKKFIEKVNNYNNNTINEWIKSHEKK
jgi:hypothetical protein